MLSTWLIVVIITINAASLFTILCIGAYISDCVQKASDRVSEELFDIQIQLTYNRLIVAWVTGDYYHITQWREKASEEEVELIKDCLRKGKFSGQNILDKLLE